MRFTLYPHPQSPPSKVSRLEVECLSSEGVARLSYSVTDCEELVVPERAHSARADNLWQTTCFELFLRSEEREDYVEFNFSPSGQWAAYRFASHRSGRSDLEVGKPPTIDGEERSGDFLLDVHLDLSGLPSKRLRMGLSAIIEEAGGRKSYWALAHPEGEPDFHHQDCFAFQLPAAERA